MPNVYRIVPLEKKSIAWVVEMYRENSDGTISWFNLEETYRWGQGFVEEDLACNLPLEGDRVAYADPYAGWGCEFEDSISCVFEFSDDISEEERQSIQDSYSAGGASWLYDGDHQWSEEDSRVEILAPYCVSLCEESGAVIQEDVKLRTRAELAEQVAANWPFSSGEGT